MKLQEVVSVTPREAIIREYNEIALGADQVRVKVAYAAAKHGTEFTHFRGEDPFIDNRYDDSQRMFVPKSNEETKPHYMRPGNMWVGEIIEIGSEVQSFALGEQVAGYGPLRTTHTVPADKLLSMPKGMTWKQAVCYDPAQFALGGVRDGNVRAGDVVVVSGLGAIGLIAAQLATLSGASCVIVCDPIERRRQAALENGADFAFDPTVDDLGVEVRKLSDNRGADVVIETSGNYHALQASIRACAYNGNISVVGWYHECHAGLDLGREAHFNQPNILISRACSEPNRDYPRWDFKRLCDTCWDMLSRGWIKCENIVDPVVPFESAAKAYMSIEQNPNDSVKLGVAYQ